MTTSNEYTPAILSCLTSAPAPAEEDHEDLVPILNTISGRFQKRRIKVREITYQRGASVTRYEVFAASMIGMRTLKNIASELELMLPVSHGGVRTEAFLCDADSMVAAFEIPNATRTPVYLGDLLRSEAFLNSNAALPFCWGENLEGEPVVADLARMPHLLIAGATGCGKSLCINGILAALLCKRSPAELRLLLIDPKRVEFPGFEEFPHLMAPVVTDPKTALAALQAMVAEMEERYVRFSACGVYNIEKYNEKAKTSPDLSPLPYLVVVIDELADLMLCCKKGIEAALCSLAQKARAAGIHLILGTQRPSADILTGMLKANIPSVVSLFLPTAADSRRVLNSDGAEKLQSRGDMLFAPVGSMSSLRMQGAFVSDDEMTNLCNTVRTIYGAAQYNEAFAQKAEALAQAPAKRTRCQATTEVEDLPSHNDPEALYRAAVDFALQREQISTALLQRKFRVGYNRALALLQRMESEGIVSAPNGSKPRTVLGPVEE
ncbi:MAG: DNA translocase FtsK [Clostridia bacterium]|nr:DNA translocase FtsK [Clostridia bacterium]